MTAPKIIGIYSPAPQSGKSTLAKILAGRGYRRMSFAAPLKQMLTVLLTAVGHDAATVDRMIDGDLKQETIPELGKSPRQLLQTLGTDWGRDLVAPDLWLEPVRAAISRGERIVVDDVRFPNEFAMIEAAGGVLVSVVRPGTDGAGHQSEGALNQAPFHVRIVNDVNIAGYRARCQEFADALG